MSDQKGENFVAMFYGLGFFGTFIYLTFFDGYIYNGWNWIIAIPINLMLSGIFPLYWVSCTGLREQSDAVPLWCRHISYQPPTKTAKS